MAMDKSPQSGASSSSAVAREGFYQDLDKVPFTTGSRFNGGSEGNQIRNSFTYTPSRDSWIVPYCEEFLKRWNAFVAKYPVESWSQPEKEMVKNSLSVLSKLNFYEDWQKETEKMRAELQAREAADQQVQSLLQHIRGIASSMK
jgi:hypothetical protein